MFWINKNNVMEKVVRCLINLIDNPPKNDNALIDAFSKIDEDDIISSMSPNAAIQLCLSVLCMTTCVLCSRGSRRFYTLVLFLYRNIVDQTVDDIVLRFIHYAIHTSSVEQCSNTRQMRNILLIILHIKIVFQRCCDTNRPIWFNHTSTQEVLAFIKSIRLGVCRRSIVTVSMLLFRMIYENPSLDIDWIIMTVDEASNIQNVKKYDMDMRILPILFAGVIRLSQSLIHDDPFIACVLSITCAMISCLHHLIDCNSDLVCLDDISKYDNIDYLSEDANVPGAIDGVVNSISDKNEIIYHIFRNIFFITNAFENTQKECERVRRFIKQKPLVLTKAIPIEQTVVSKKHQFSFGGNIVFLTDDPTNIHRTKTITFFSVLMCDIDATMKKGQTCLGYGPLVKVDESSSNTTKIRDLNIRVNVFVNDVKVTYQMNNLPIIPFISRVTMKNERTKRVNVSKTRPNRLEFIMANIDNAKRIISAHTTNEKTSDWLVTSDPFDDYRRRNWDISFNFNQNVAIRYIDLNKTHTLCFNGSKMVSLKALRFSAVMDRSKKALNVMQSLYFTLIYKAAFGINVEYPFSDLCIIDSIDDVKPHLLGSIHDSFSQPRYPPYHYDKRINLLTFFADDEKKTVRWLRTNITKNFSTFRQNEIDRFFKKWNDIIEPIIKELYNKAVNTQDFKYSRVTKAHKKKLKSKSYNKYNVEDLMFSINTLYQYNTGMTTLTGSLHYMASMVLGIDSNVYGIDIVEIFSFMIDFRYDKKETFVKIYDQWLWSLANKTPILANYDENRFSPNYPTRPPHVIIPVGIDFAKGWIMRKGNMQLMIDTLERWIEIIAAEIERVSALPHDHKDSRYHPSHTWLANKYLPEVLNAHIMLKRMYEKAIDGDMWDFCEFHFGKFFLRRYIDSFKHSIRSAFKLWRFGKTPMEERVF